jgi:predicted RND superfamily exporter protein
MLVMLWTEVLVDSDTQAMMWEDELEEIGSALSSESIEFLMGDETLIPTWIHCMIKRDAPSLLALAALVVLLIVTLHMRRIRRILIVVSPLVVGMLGLMAMIHVLGMELNMFNIIVIPSVIGIGIDNVVHIYHRYMHEGPGSVGLVLRHTGVAVLLASLTTMAGFGSALIAHHLGLRSMGALAILSIGYALLAAMVFFPALLVTIESLGQRGR